MEEEIIIEKLKKAIERATKNVIMINSFYSYIPFTSTEGELEPGYIEQYEALVKAMISTINWSPLTIFNNDLTFIGS